MVLQISLNKISNVIANPFNNVFFINPMEVQNPWWSRSDDSFIQDWNAKKIKWEPNLLKDLCLDPFALHFLTGPRQVGKTTVIKLLIHRLLKEGWDPFSIFYYQCDYVLNFKELDEILNRYLATRDARQITHSIIIIDEITYVKEWWRSIKAKIDQNLFNNDVVIITGSASIELLKEKERFPGRRGNGQDYCLSPLSFQEYISIFIPELISHELSLSKTIEQVIAPNQIFQSKIDQFFQNYLITGGFPGPIQDFYTLGKIRPETKRTYLDWIIGDVSKAGKNMMFMKEILSYILRTRLSPVSWLSLTKETSLNSPHTSQDYVETLAELFIVHVTHQISPTGTILYRKNKKIHFSDPFIARILAEYTNTPIIDDQLVESLVANHFNRRDSIYYYFNQTEIDVVTKIDDQLVGFEVKWGPIKWKQPMGIKTIFLLTKEFIPIFLASILWNKKKK